MGRLLKWAKGDLARRTSPWLMNFLENGYQLPRNNSELIVFP